MERPPQLGDGSFQVTILHICGRGYLISSGVQPVRQVLKTGLLKSISVARDFEDLIEVARSGRTHSAVYDQYGFVYEQNKLGNECNMLC